MSKRIYAINDHYFDQIDTEEKAYMLGFFTADGCNYEDKGCFKIDLSRQDEYILQRFADLLEFTGPIRHYDDIEKTFSTNEQIYICQPTSRLMFRSRQITTQLSLKGCVAHKSSNSIFIKPGIIPNELFNHYVRGLMDGDGGISYWEDNPNTHHLKFSVNYCSTVNMVNSLAAILGSKFNCHPLVNSRYEERNNNNLQFNICGNIVVENILNWLYKDSTIYLERKYEKYLILLKERERVKNDHSLYGNAFPKRKVIRLSDGKIYESVSQAAKDNSVNSSNITCRCKSKNGFDYYCEA